MHISALGHATLKVRDLERSVPFYRDVLGMREVARYRDHMVFFSLGTNHHDLALLELGPGAPNPPPRALGLYHLAFKVGDSLEELKAVKEELLAKGIPVTGQSDHWVSQSLYLADPDGNELELYVDADPELWRENPTLVAHVGPLDI
jgi:Predicted ring-cleavage extradiol dioxygenase